ncbi:MAG: type II secretion system GspH family protein [Deltaproteobacteria bacterium]|jgi:prepilin-type N-terminal cleavage/methylation domain-containing protein|nr:type II secretion system GspH family protein [Deltaproteobacteria bacterium]
MLGKKSGKEGFTLIEMLAITMIVSIIASIALPRWFTYRRLALDRVAIAAGRSVQTAEEIYFGATGQYTDSYENLRIISGLEKDGTVIYGPIELSFNRSLRVSGFRFSVRNKAEASTVYVYDSLGSEGTLTSTYAGLDASAW